MPLPNLYGKYTDPYRLVEFRMFLLNLCNMGCKGCFYQKDGNTFGSYDEATKLAYDLARNGYNLETCYLLPTDIFDNKANKALFTSPQFFELISLFRYIGIASTLTEGWDPAIFDSIHDAGSGVELQVNLVMNKMFDPSYEGTISKNIQEVLSRYPETVLNLAVNVGFKMDKQEIAQIHTLVNKLSVDKIVEVNFTFLYNSLIGPVKKRKMMIESWGALREFSDLYVEEGDPRFNGRTMLRKPSFTFKDGKIYVSPIMPFDEYVFLDNDKYTLREPTFDGFLEVNAQMETENLPIIDECDTCPNLTTCHGKGFFVIANELNLPCYLEENK